MTEKKCNRCDRTLPIESFRQKKYRSGTIGHRAECRECEHKRINELKKTYPPPTITELECKTCHKILTIECFARRTDTPLGYYSHCRECTNKRKIHDSRRFRENHKKPQIVNICDKCGKEFTAKNKRQKLCSDECRTALSERRIYLKTLTPEQRIIEKKQYIKQWHATHKEQVRQWHVDNKERTKELNKKHKAEHLIEYRAKAQARKKKRMSNDIDYKLKVRLSNTIRQSINGNKQYKHSIDLLGCSVIDARKHIERQFQPGMTWDNWGVFGWHLDHIIPVASFDFTDYEQQKRCFHYTNLQPLWWLDNVMKADKIVEKQLCLM